MAELRTQRNHGDVGVFIDSIEDEVKREDSHHLVEMMERLSGHPAEMWGTSIVGFGEYAYETRDGKSHNWFRVGFSPRKQNLTLYVMTGFDRYGSYLSQLGKHSTGKSCLYVKKLEDIDRAVLEKMITASLEATENRKTDTGSTR